MAHLSSVVDIAESFADGVVSLRTNRLTKLQMAKKHGAQPREIADHIAGGFVKSYKFTCHNLRKTAFDGTVQIYFGDESSFELEATFLVMDGSRNTSGADRIVRLSSALSDSYDGVLNAYFCTFNPKLNNWIVAYEKYATTFHHAVEATGTIPAFFEDGVTKLTLNEFWRNAVRSIIEIIASAKAMGGIGTCLRTRNCLVMTSSMQLKIMICLGQTIKPDLWELSELFLEDTFFNASTSQAWKSFDTLLRSTLASSGTPSEWKKVLLNHPMLLSETKDILSCYEQITKFMWDLSCNQRIDFANALAYLTPSFYGRGDITVFYRNGNFAAWQRKEYDDLFKNHFANYGTCTHINIIQFVRNVIRHGKRWNDEEKLCHVRLLYREFMDFAYSVSSMTESEWTELRNNTDRACGYYKPY